MADEKDAPEAPGKIDTKGLKEEHIPAVNKGEGHEVSFDMDGLPDKLYVDDLIQLTLFASCSSGCDLVGDSVTMTNEAGDEVASAQFTTQEGELACTEPMLLTMPAEPGDVQYVIHYEPRELPLPDDGGPRFDNPHEARDLLLVLTVEPHHVSVSTWGLTTPVYVSEPAKVCVGVSCSGGCDLGGCKVEVVDDDGKLQASGTLRTPEAPRDSLWWDELTFTAPDDAKLHRYEARFDPSSLEMPHEAATHKFSFVSRVRPERNFVIHVIDDKADKPLRSARVELKPTDGGKAQFASTDSTGKASLGTTKGEFDLKVTSPSKRAYNVKVDLTPGDLEVEIRMSPASLAAEQIPMKVIAGSAAPAGEGKQAEAAQPAAVSESGASSSTVAKPATEGCPAEGARVTDAPAAAAPAIETPVPDAPSTAAPAAEASSAQAQPEHRDGADA